MAASNAAASTGRVLATDVIWQYNLCRAPQQADKKPVGIGPARRHQETVLRDKRRAAEKIGALAERVEDIGRLFHGKIRMAGAKCPDLIAVLLRQHRTGDVGDAAAWLEKRHRPFQYGLLLF